MSGKPHVMPNGAPISAVYHRYALIVLMIISTLNFLDRQIVSILAEPIKEDLQLADWHVGLMSGLAFALFYTTMGIPIARYAETGNRPRIIGVAVGLWSLLTIACGTAQNLVQMILYRMAVGVGEAGCTPTAHSLISDYTPREKRGSAFALYSMGTPLGALLGMAVGGLIADAYGWRTAFFVAGVPGIVMAVVAFTTLVEPRRKQAASIAASRPTGPTFKDAMREIRSKRAFWLFALGGAAKTFIGYGTAAFLAPFFIRIHGAELTGIAQGFGLGLLGFLGIALGLILGLTGALGTWAGGYLADRFGARDLRWYPAIPAIATAIGVPFYIVGLLVDSATLALAIFVVPSFLHTLWYGPSFAAVQGLVQPHTRATASAVLLFVINLLGLGLGPLAVGIVSDIFSVSLGMGAAEGVRWSLVVFVSLGFLATFVFWAARKSIREETVS